MTEETHEERAHRGVRERLTLEWNKPGQEWTDRRCAITRDWPELARLLDVTTVQVLGPVKP
jgi:hypothetical protein